MTSFSSIDKARRREVRHTLDALPDVEAFTASLPLKQAFLVLRGDLECAFESFLDALREVARERKETRDTVIILSAARESALNHYHFIRESLTRQLQSPTPWRRATHQEADDLKRLIVGAFSDPTTQLSKLPHKALVEHLRGPQRALQALEDTFPLRFASHFTQAINALEAAIVEWLRESSEDDEATEALRHARANLDVALRVYTLFLESLLMREGKSEELGEYLLSKDLSYLTEEVGSE